MNVSICENEERSEMTTSNRLGREAAAKKSGLLSDSVTPSFKTGQVGFKPIQFICP